MLLDTLKEFQRLATKLLDRAEAPRSEAPPESPLKHKSALGQFMTPASVASFMASLFPPSNLQTCRLLDAGAGLGALSAAFLERCAKPDGLKFDRIELDAYEIDATLRSGLEQTLERFAHTNPCFNFTLSPADFILDAAFKSLKTKPYSHAILNPPYKKINSASQHRLILRCAGIETVNLYTAFVALALCHMQPRGQLVAIIPRSFCNGPYYRPFRDFILNRAALQHIHLFASRSSAFKKDDVLQENVIIRIERSAKQGPVTITHSSDDTFSDLSTHQHDFDQIVFPSDPEQFIHIPTSNKHGLIEHLPGIRFSLAEIGLAVSTGPVVDFRLLEHILPELRKGSVPLLYPGHFADGLICWPKEGIKRGNAIALNAETSRWLFPSGFYTVTRRFSAKEERRRIVASVVDPAALQGAKLLGFENHLNVFHERKSSLPTELAHGLAAFLNTTAVDTHFRRFNGHTQVNATDLKLMKYPSRAALTELGAWAKSQPTLTQALLDNQLKKLTHAQKD